MWYKINYDALDILQELKKKLDKMLINLFYFIFFLFVKQNIVALFC